MSSDDEYPQLRAVLREYISTGKEDILVLRYQKVGEESAEFDGLGADLQKAAKAPESAADLFREELGFEGDVSEIRHGCIELYDRLKGVGDFDAAKQDRVEGSELFDQYAGIPLMIGGRPVVVRGRTIPLWGGFAGSVAILALAYLLGNILPLPGFLQWIPALLRIVGFAAFAVTSFALIGKRGEVRDPGKAARREKAIAEAKAKRDEKRERKGDNGFRRNMSL